MAADGMIGNGVRVGYRTLTGGSPIGPWVGVGQLLNDVELGMVRDKVDRTVHGTNIFKRSLPGMADFTDITLEVLSDPDPATTEGAAQKALNAFVATGETLQWRIEVPVDRAQSAYFGTVFDAFILSRIQRAPIADKQVRAYVLTFDGDSVDEDSAAGNSQIT